jgi:hypothetical protein
VKRLRDDGSFDDQAIGAEAAEVVVRATNRFVHVFSFISGRQGQLPLLSLFDLENFVCEDLYGGTPRVVALGGLLLQRRIPLREPSAAQASNVQAGLNAPPAAFHAAETLWLDGLEAFYDGRFREAVILLRAGVEVAWRAAFDRSMEAYGRCAISPLPQGILQAYSEHATGKRMGLPARLTEHSKVVFGFSFKDDWEPGRTTKWDRLTAFFQTRHSVAHGSGQPSTAEVWDGLTLTREVLTKLTTLSDAVIRQCP